MFNYKNNLYLFDILRYNEYYKVLTSYKHIIYIIGVKSALTILRCYPIIELGSKESLRGFILSNNFYRGSRFKRNLDFKLEVNERNL